MTNEKENQVYLYGTTVIYILTLILGYEEFNIFPLQDSKLGIFLEQNKEIK